MVDSCLDLMGPLEVSPCSREELVAFAAEGGNFSWDGAEQTQASLARVSELLQFVVALRE